MKLNLIDRVDDPERGIAWARGGLIFGVLASVAGNIGNTILTESAIALGWRVPGAAFWPLALFAGIEIMVRNRHRTSPLGYVGRGLLLLVSVTTFVTSFVNLNAYMIKTDEPWLATISGPIGVDGLMLGSTVMLLAATMKLAQHEERELHSGGIIALPQPVILDEDERVVTLADMLPQPIEDIPVSPAPAGAERIRKPRGEASPALKQAVKAIIAGDKPEIGEGASRATLTRYAAAWRTLRDNPNAEIAVSTNADLLLEMRAAARSERVR